MATHHQPDPSPKSTDPSALLSAGGELAAPPGPDRAQGFAEISELSTQYDGKRIAALVEAATHAPIRLDSSQRYYIEMKGSTVHIYGMDRGIDAYDPTSTHAQQVSVTSVRATARGIELGVSGAPGGVDSYVLHSDPYAPAGKKADSGASKGVQPELMPEPAPRVYKPDYHARHREPSESGGPSGER